MKGKILYIADTEGVSGYAQSARRTVFSLQDAGIDLSVRYVPHDSNVTSDRAALNRVRSLYGEGGVVAIHHQIPHMFKPIPNAYNIGFTMFETTKIPREWVEYCAKMDEIWVPSTFNRNIFLKSGVRQPVHVVPFPVDTTFYIPKKTDRNVVRFLSLFQWTERKNWRALIQAYITEFRHSEDVELYLKVYAASSSESERQSVSAQIEDEIRRIGNMNRPRHILDFSIKTEKDLVGLYQNSDVFVLPSRGESIGLGYMEAMACEVPCIATNWGGQTEFIDDTTGYLVNYKLEPVTGIPHIREYRKDQKWASVEVADLRAKMREAFADANGRKSRGGKARGVITSRYSGDAISSVIEKRLKALSYNTKGASKKVPAFTYRGDAFGISGYANAIRLNLEALRRSSADIFLEPVFHDRRQIEDGPLRTGLARLTEKKPAGKILIDHQTPEFYKSFKDKYAYQVGVTYFETSRIPARWVSKCNDMDEIWLPCKHNVDAFRNSGVTSRIETMEPYLDTDHFHPDKKPWNISNKAGFTFLSVFEFIQRKGWDVLVEAYARAFDRKDDVCLIIKTYRMHPPMSEADIKARLKAHLLSRGLKSWPRILVYAESLPYSVLPHLYAACDAFVLPTRGEALCYPALEAMATAKPCIVTNTGGPATFLNDKNGYLLGYKEVPVKNFDHSPWYTSDQMMAEPDVNELVSLFRKVYDDRAKAAQKGRLARQDVERKHSMTAGFSRLTKRLADIGQHLNL